jgi:protein phosphatase
MTARRKQGSIASAQIRGDRAQQEDALAVHEFVLKEDSGKESLLLVLADGMGGHVGGEVASEQAVRYFSKACRAGRGDVFTILRESLNSANERLASVVTERPGLTGMGTTLTACVINGNAMYWISVGDSPMWVFHGGALDRINEDHSMVPLLEDMVSNGLMSRVEARADYRRNILRSAVTGKKIELVDLCREPRRLMAGDIVMLASDGIETLDDEELAAVLGNPDGVPLQSLADEMMTLIKSAEQDGQDNASIILYQR